MEIKIDRFASQGWSYSVALHAILGLIVFVGLPSFFSKPEEQPRVITAEILPISAISNVRPNTKAPVSEEKPKSEPKPESKPIQKDVKKEAKPEPEPLPDTKPKPEEKKPEEKLEKKPEPVKKPKEEKKKEKKKDDVDSDLDSVLKSVEKSANQNKSEDTAKKESGEDAPQAESDVYDPSEPLSLSEMDYIKQQISKNWTMPTAVVSAENLVVAIRVDLDKDGTVTKVDIVDKRRYASDPYFRAAADSARTAVLVTKQITGLPPEKYGTWSKLELTFDPTKDLNW